MRVLDLTDAKGMLCGRILADLGADVIKVEKPGGDIARNIGPFYKDIPDSEKSLFWFAFNANKKGITLDIEKKDGKVIFENLVKSTDVVIESFAPGHLNSLDLGYESLAKINSKVILTSITPFGQTGPYRDFKGPDIVVNALGGFLYLCGDEDRPPVRISFPQAYLHAAGQASVGTLIARYHQLKTGEGQHVDVSAQQSVLWTALSLHQYLEVGGIFNRRAGHSRLLRGQIKRRMNWRCKDGYVNFSIYSGVFGAPFNQAITQWLDEEGIAPDWMKNKDWSSFDMTRMNLDELEQAENALEKLFIKYTKRELYNEALKRRILFAPIQTPGDLLSDPQLEARGFWQDVEHPELMAKIIYPGPFVKGTEISCKIRLPAPLIGEHNEEIYIKQLDLSKNDLVTLKQSGVI